MHNKDIVYILGSGSRWNNNEIKYSLRSLKNIPHRSVFIIGERLPWFQNIEHVPADDPYVNKQRNAIHKLSIACELPTLSEDFILMNDDFYIIEPLTDIPVHYKDSIIETAHFYKAFKKYKPINKTKTSRYIDAIRNTYKRYPHGFNYSMHIPIVLNKKRLRQTLDRVGDDPCLLRAEYGNEHKIGGTQLQDVKIRKMTETPVGSFLSSHDTIRHDLRFQEYLREQFSEPSIYETPPTV